MEIKYSEERKQREQWMSLAVDDTLTDVPLKKYRSIASDISVARAVTQMNWRTSVDRANGCFSVVRTK